MKEYLIENNADVDLSKLESDFVIPAVYTGYHRNMPIPCHDIIIEYGRGALLVERTEDPFKGELWPAGGRISRGVPMLDSLRGKVRKETGLELDGIVYLDWARTFATTDPFGHGRGADTFNFMYFAKGSGELKTDKTIKRTTIIHPDDFAQRRDSLHPYVQDFLDMAMPRIR